MSKNLQLTSDQLREFWRFYTEWYSEASDEDLQELASALTQLEGSAAMALKQKVAHAVADSSAHRLPASLLKQLRAMSSPTAKAFGILL